MSETQPGRFEYRLQDDDGQPENHATARAGGDGLAVQCQDCYHQTTVRSLLTDGCPSCGAEPYEVSVLAVDLGR